MSRWEYRLEHKHHLVLNRSYHSYLYLLKLFHKKGLMHYMSHWGYKQVPELPVPEQDKLLCYKHLFLPDHDHKDRDILPHEVRNLPDPKS